MKKNNNNGKTTTVIAILVILLIVLSCYIGYDKVLKKNGGNVNSGNINEKNKVNTDDESDSTEKNVYNSFNINNYKCLIDCDNIEYSLGASVAGDGIEVWVANDEQTKINVNIDRNLLKNIHGYQFYSDEDMYTFEFSKKIQDVFVGNIGQDSTIPMIFVLSEDGTVQFIDLYRKIENGVSNQKELENVKNVIKFYSAGSRLKGSTGAGIMTVLAQTSDGNFYDLAKVIYKQ